MEHLPSGDNYDAYRLWAEQTAAAGPPADVPADRPPAPTEAVPAPAPDAPGRRLTDEGMTRLVGHERLGEGEPDLGKLLATDSTLLPAGELPRADGDLDLSALASFEPYRAQMQAADALLDAGVAPEDLPGYLGRGGCVVALETEDGKVLKLPRFDPENDDEYAPVPDPTATCESYIRPLLKAQGDPVLEQIDTAVLPDPETGRRGGLVCEMAAGAVVDEAPEAVWWNISREHLDKLWGAVQRLADNGMVPELDRQHLYIDPEKGFTIIDFHDVSEGAPAMSTTEMAVRYTDASLLMSQLHAGELVPPVGERILESVRSAFGDEAAAAVLTEWRESGCYDMRTVDPRPTDLPIQYLPVAPHPDAGRRTGTGPAPDYYVPGHPELAATRNDSDVNHYTAYHTKTAAEHLVDYGLHVTASQPVFFGEGHSYNSYMVTRRIEGTPLADALRTKAGAPADLLQEVDTAWSGMVRNLADCFSQNRVFLTSKLSPANFTYGVPAGAPAGTAPHLWLSHLPAAEVAKWMSDGEFREKIFDTALSLSAMEIQARTTFPGARAAIGQLLQQYPPTEAYGHGLHDAVRRVLRLIPPPAEPA